MRWINILLAILLGGSTAIAELPSPQRNQRTIEVCFVLDTTGSMGGLIEGAKAKIWSIANCIIGTNDQPQVRFALVGYRDKGDEYVTKVFDLTDDIDAVYKHLEDFQAAGGGDEPESVNQALDEAVHKIHWTAAKEVTKIIFLVGDAPPHMDYQDDVKYPQVCQEAARRNLIINTVQCGSIAATTPIWQEIAQSSNGSYVALGQTGDMVIIATPFDKDLSQLNTEMNATIVPYGSIHQQEEVRSKVQLATDAPAAAAADRLGFNNAQAKAIQGEGDLIQDLRDDRVKLDEVAAKDLPQAMQKMNLDEQKAYLAQQSAQRADVQSKIAELTRKRQEYLNAENKKSAANNKDSFDAKVAEIVKDEASRNQQKQ
jgi:Mg-chelatase subunit ChlD